MSAHPNVSAVNEMTEAVFNKDRAALGKLFADDMVFHMRGPLPRAGDHQGVDGFLGAMGAIFELTDGDVKIQQLYCEANDAWAVEWEHAVLGRNGNTLDTNNVFVYRFEGNRIAELWMLSAAPQGSEAFWS